MNAFEPITRLLPTGLRSLLKAPPPSEPALRLANILGVDAAELERVRMGPRYHYRPFTIGKSDGRERRILAPSPALKSLQRRFLDNYLSALPVHFSATAFHAGCSIVRNARRHARQVLIAT